VRAKPERRTSSSVVGPKDESRYGAKLKDFRNGMGEEAPVSNDMMNEWRNQRGLPPA
jgi:hypothetical protein